MSGYRPGAAAVGRDAHIGYSPYVRPMLVGGVKCVVVDERSGSRADGVRLRHELARDNELPVRGLHDARAGG